MLMHHAFNSDARNFLHSCFFLRFNHANIRLSTLMLLYQNTQDWVIYKEKKLIFLPFSSLANPSSND